MHVWWGTVRPTTGVQPPLAVASNRPFAGASHARGSMSACPTARRCPQVIVKAAVWWARCAKAGMEKSQLVDLGILDAVFSVRYKLALDHSSAGVATLRTDGGAGTMALVRLPGTHPRPAPSRSSTTRARPLTRADGGRFSRAWTPWWPL
jgi:hypothetical protein